MVKMTVCLILITLYCFSFTSNLYAQDKRSLAKLSMSVCQQDERPIIRKYTDLPNHTYKFPLKVSELFESEEHMLTLAKEMKKNIQSDLKAHQFKDKDVLKWVYSHLFNANIIDQQYERALEIINKVKTLETHEENAQLWGIPAEAIVKTYIQVNIENGLNFNEGLKTIFKKQLKALPWNVFKETIKNMAIQEMLDCKSYLLSDYLQKMDKTQEELKGEIDTFMANDLISFWVSVKFILPQSDTLISIFMELINSHNKDQINIWDKRSFDLKKSTDLTPVTVAIWDSGVDTSMFKGKLWRNKEEEYDGLDNDRNGFVDDVHGIGYDLSGARISELLRSVNKMSISVDEAAIYFKGYMDLIALDNSLEAQLVRRIRKKSRFEDYVAFMKDIEEYGHFAHGTFIASIVVEGNPFIRIQVVRADFHSDEFIPSLDLAKKYAEAQWDTIRYCNESSVRIVNMSWSESRDYLESYLLNSGYDKSEEEKDKLIEQVLNIISDSLYNSIKEAPEILFVTSAGNNGGDVDSCGMIPSMLKLPNLVSVAAANKEGKLSNISSYGKTVEFLAEGTAVENYAPGGFIVKSSGSSQACAKYVNLAAKILAIDPTLTPSQLISLIKKGSDRIRYPMAMYLINPRRTVKLLTTK